MLEEIVEGIRQYLDEQEEIRERIVNTSHKIIRNSSRTMASLHRRGGREIKGILDRIREDLRDLNAIVKSEPQFSDHGSFLAAHREFAEVILSMAIAEGRDIPGPEEIGVHQKAYVQALAESLGELRRSVLNLLLNNKVDEARAIFGRMEEVFDLLLQFDYPDSILPGMRRRQDVARRSIERTRADITRAAREEDLKESLRKTSQESGKR